MPRVFVVQNTQHKNPFTKELEPKFDLNPALEYGRLVYLLSPSASPFHPETIIPELQRSLEDFQPDDYLLMIGNPVLIGLAFAIAAHYTNGDVRALQWSGRSNKYIAIDIKNCFPFE